jgi:hypothetical protein
MSYWFFRKKYEQLLFMECDDNAACAIVPAQGRSLSLLQSSSSCYTFHMDPKKYEKAPTKHRIGHAFRNSWARKDSEHKSSKKSTSLVMFHLKYSFLSQLMQQISYIVLKGKMINLLKCWLIFLLWMLSFVPIYCYRQVWLNL